MTLPPSLALNELEIDALTEVVNIGVGRAAASLRLLVGDEVSLSVPSVAMVTREEAAQLIGEREAGKLVAVQQAFDGDIYGRALLIFPAPDSLELVKAAIGRELGLGDIIELEPEALAEIGNIILNGCLGTIANLLRQSLEISFPEILRGTGHDFFGLSSASASEEAVLFLYIHFSVKKRDIRGYIAIMMDLPALASLRLLIDELIASTTGEPYGVHVTT